MTAVEREAFAVAALRAVVTLLIGVTATACNNGGERCLVREGAIAHCAGYDSGFLTDSFYHPCDPLAQSGCQTGEKCTWLEDGPTPPGFGHVGCAPSGNVPMAGPCTYGPAGYDNCVGGAVCSAGTCALICDHNGGSSTCERGMRCSLDPFLFKPWSQPAVAGICKWPHCDPLDDNDFLGSGHKPGTNCDVGIGCYGAPGSNLSTGPTETAWTCFPEARPTLVHRYACTAANGCADPSPTAYVYFNACAQGYLPLLYDATGSIQITCVAMCKPGNAYAANPDAQYPVGQSPHTCTTTDARGVFDTATDGDHCMYSWRLEGALRSPTSDTVGFCIDHSKYRYDSNGDGMIDNNDATWPACTSLPLAGSAQPRAADFGCVNTATTPAGLPLMQLDLRIPYGAMP